MSSQRGNSQRQWEAARVRDQGGPSGRSVLVSEQQQAAGRLASCPASGPMAGARELAGGGPALLRRYVEFVRGPGRQDTLLRVFLGGTWTSFITESSGHPNPVQPGLPECVAEYLGPPPPGFLLILVTQGTGRGG
ncbi:unnamed protein product [Rangifer tarandus platyrhynchus]|uniref:Uncharacterized protein n=1 Tax=Rangifer tarandus platyrhynchus TaxID=3082113 RepID=A0AC59Y8X8_RANTA